jgi:hypothetical protein
VNEVVVLIPSRNRPESLLKTWESVRDTSDAAVVAYIDSDQDEVYGSLPATYVRYEKPGSGRIQVVTERDPNLIVLIGPRVGPIHSINTLYRLIGIPGALGRLLPKANIFTYLTDDSTIGPRGWDEYLIRTIEGFPKQMGVVSLYHGADYVNFYALSKAMISAVGFYAIPEANHAWYWDTAMELVGDATRIVYSKARDVEINHAVQITRDSQGLPDEDCRRFAHWCISERKRIIQSVRDQM